MSARSKIGRKQEAVIAALLTERTLADAAAKAGIGEATLQRWLRDKAFVKAFRAARRDLLESALTALQATTGEAIDALKRNLRCGHGGTEVKAASTVLSTIFKTVEFIDGTAILDEVDELNQETRTIHDSLRAEIRKQVLAEIEKEGKPR